MTYKKVSELEVDVILVRKNVSGVLLQRSCADPHPLSLLVRFHNPLLMGRKLKVKFS